MHSDDEATAPRTVIPWLVAILAAVLVMVAIGLAPLGARPAAAQSAPPTEASASNWTRISAGGAFTCGIRSTGRLYCWGDDSVGQLGNGANGASAIPVEIAGTPATNTPTEVKINQL